MKVLITGGAGYIGVELVQHLLNFEEVEKIIIYDNLSRNNFNLFLGNKLKNGQKLQFEEAELLDSRSLRKCLEGVDVVYHLAAKVTTPFANQDPHFYEQVNHWGTAELVDAAENAGIKHFIFTSSASVYGTENKILDEKARVNPRTFYGISKLRAEEHVRRLNSDSIVHIVRCGNVFGYSPAMRFDAVINKFVFNTNFKKKIQVHGDGSQMRPFIHIAKIAHGLAKLPFSELESGTYNMVEHNLSVNDIVDVLKTRVPELEFMMVNQHLSLRSVTIKPNIKVNSLFKGMDVYDSFEHEIRDFIDHFTF